jgi:hypothetical protein
MENNDIVTVATEVNTVAANSTKSEEKEEPVTLKPETVETPVTESLVALPMTETPVVSEPVERAAETLPNGVCEKKKKPAVVKKKRENRSRAIPGPVQPVDLGTIRIDINEPNKTAAPVATDDVVTAVILAFDSELFDRWLGPKTVLQWTWDKIAKIPGIDRKLILTTANKLTNLRWVYPPAIKQIPNGVLSLDDTDRDYEAVRWLFSEESGVSLSEYVLVVNGSQPFVPFNVIADLLPSVARLPEKNAVSYAARALKAFVPDTDTTGVAYDVRRSAWACDSEFLRAKKADWKRAVSITALQDAVAFNIFTKDDYDIACLLADHMYKMAVGGKKVTASK